MVSSACAVRHEETNCAAPRTIQTSIMGMRFGLEMQLATVEMLLRLHALAWKSRRSIVIVMGDPSPWRQSDRRRCLWPCTAKQRPKPAHRCSPACCAAESQLDINPKP